MRAGRSTSTVSWPDECACAGSTSTKGEAACWVVPPARGRGVATRVLRAVTDWMFTHIGLHRVYLQHSTRNEASCRVAAGAEFLAAGTKRSAGLHLDSWHDMHLHARVNRERSRP